MDKKQQEVIRRAVNQEVARLGSQVAVARKVGLNHAYISQIVTGNHSTLKEEHWAQVAERLDVLVTDWKLVDTNNGRQMHGLLETAKQNAMFVAVSSNAGSGKTVTCRQYREQNARRSVYYYRVEHASMGKTEFLKRLAAALGLDTLEGSYRNGNGIADAVIAFFGQRLHEQPLLIVDEADKLNDKAICFFISLYNVVEGKMGCVIIGTDHLERRVKKGVEWQKNGFDEIDSRFGRRFVRLDGYTLAEVRNICSANGLQDPDIQRSLFEECGPASVMIGTQSFKVLRDLRPLRRKVERELLLNPNLKRIEVLKPQEAATP